MEYHIGEDGAMGATAEKLLRDIVRFHRHTHTAPPSPQDAAVLLAKLALKRADDEGEGEGGRSGEGEGGGTGAASAKEESVDRARRGVARAEARRDRAAQAQEHASFLKMHDDRWGQGPRLWAQHVQRRVLQVYARHEKKDAELCAKDLNALCKLPVGFIGHECRKMVARKLLRRITVTHDGLPPQEDGGNIQQRGRFAVRAIEAATEVTGRKRKRDATAATTKKHLHEHFQAIEDTLSEAVPFPDVSGAEAAATIFAQRALMCDGEAKRGVMAIELLDAERLESSEALQSLKKQCSDDGARLLVVRGSGLTISLWLDIAFGVKRWEFRALPLPRQNADKQLASIRDVKSGDVLVLTCKETGDQLKATVGRRVQSWNVATQNAEKATEDGVAGAEEEEEEEEGITVRATIFN